MARGATGIRIVAQIVRNLRGRSGGLLPEKGGATSATSEVPHQLRERVH